MRDAVVRLPAFVNAHSHAFQRALRGRVEQRSAQHPNDDFWAWRSTMYADAAQLSPDDVYAIARWAYADMLRAGFVAVGEFHYLHHDRDGTAYTAPMMSLALARAALDVGLALTLLETAYFRAGFQKALQKSQQTAPQTPLQPGQQRFVFPTTSAFIAHVERVRAQVPGGTRVGMALHSVRACPRPAIAELARYAAHHQLMLHVHACEQRAELAACEAEHHMSPIALLDVCGALTPRTTVVHATHLVDDDIKRLANSGARVCLTPSTERNLGDGLCRIADLHAAGVPLCIGSDSHARIDAFDEMRSVEDHERLRLERRNVLVAPGGQLADALLPIGSGAGATSVDYDLGQAVVDVRAPRVANRTDAHVKNAILLGASPADVINVRDAAGRLLVADGRLTLANEDDIDTAAQAVIDRLTSL